MKVEHKKHLFFDMDQTVAPARQLILPEMYKLISTLPHDIVIVSGQLVEKIAWQSNNLKAYYLGQNGNHANDLENTDLWKIELEQEYQDEIMRHIHSILEILDEKPNDSYDPIEKRSSQITFSPVGNTAPSEIKMKYDPDRKKRNTLLARVPFESENLTVKIGGSTSFDYIHKDRHKGTNVQKLIDMMDWNADECVYFGDGLFSGGNDEAVIGVIDTVPVDDHEHTHALLKKYFS